MAEWKKVVVSGSSAALAGLTVDGTITGSISGNAATVTTNANLTGDVTSVGNATTIAAGAVENTMLVNDGLMLGTTDISLGATGSSIGGLTLTTAVGSGSFSGSFQGDGSGLSGITAEWDGTREGNSSITGSSAGPSLALSGSTGTDLSVSKNATIGGDLSVTGNITTNGNTVLGNAQTDITQVTGSFNLSGSFDIDVTGNNNGYDFTVDGVSDPALTFQTKKGFGAPKISLLRNAGFPNAKSVELGSGGDDGTIRLYKENESQPDVSLNSHNVSIFGRNLLVGTRDTTIISGYDGLAVSGSSKIKGDLDVTGSLKLNGSNVVDFTSATAISGSTFSGSFVGDGSGLTGIASTLTVDGDSGTQNVDLTADDLQVLGTANEISTAVTKVGTDVKVTVGLPDDVTIGQDLSVTRDLTVSRNLVVQGTASFQSTEDLDVKDRFIRMASGSTSAGDGGIVIQQTNALNGEVFGFDSDTTRFGLSGSFDASQNTFTPDAFVSAVVVGGSGETSANVVARYQKPGNIFVQDNGDVHIYV